MTASRTFAFISRHKPTMQQVEFVERAGIVLFHVGDIDAFAADASERIDSLRRYGYSGVVCVHPVIALKAYQRCMAVGVFQNINRAPVGEAPNFEAGQFVVFEPGQEVKIV